MNEEKRKRLAFMIIGIMLGWSMCIFYTAIYFKIQGI